MDVEIKERVDDSDFDLYAEEVIQTTSFFFIKMGDWRKRMVYSEELLAPLTRLDGEIKKVGIKVFDLIMKICQKRKNQDFSHLEGPLIRRLIEILLNNPAEIKDECFFQLIKQTTENPHQTRTLNEWKLLAIVASFVSPSESFLYFFINKMEKIFGETLSDDVKQWTKYIVKRVLQTNEKSERFVLPCVEELRAIEDRRKIPLEVYFPNGASEIFFLESYSTLEELKDEIVLKYSFPADFKSFYGFYEYCSKRELNEENFIDDKIKAMDVVGSWSNEIDFLKKKQEDDPEFTFSLHYRLYFVIRFHFENSSPAHEVL